MPNTYLAGTLVRVSATFTSITGAATDPTTVTLKYRPGQAASVITAVYPAAPIIKDSTGAYHADLDTTNSAPGVTPWTHEWIGTGAVQAVAVGSFQVTEPAV